MCHIQDGRGANAQDGLFDGSPQCVSNINPEYGKSVADELRFDYLPEHSGNLEQRRLGPEDIFYYVYAILNSNSYRVAYNDLLKEDFPRIPRPQNAAFLFCLADCGRRLAQLHLGASGPDVGVGYPVDGNNKVIAVRTEVAQGAAETLDVHINDTQLFSQVPVQAWEYTVGRYPVLARWLKARRGRRLELDDVEHFQSSVNSIMAALDVVSDIENCIVAQGGLW